jgi:hypothetical protein
MSGIIQSAKSKYLGLDMRERSQAVEETSELPTLADLLLPGTGYKFSDEFACLLRLLGDERKPA